MIKLLYVLKKLIGATLDKMLYWKKNPLCFLNSYCDRSFYECIRLYVGRELKNKFPSQAFVYVFLTNIVFLSGDSITRRWRCLVLKLSVTSQKLCWKMFFFFIFFLMSRYIDEDYHLLTKCLSIKYLVTTGGGLRSIVPIFGGDRHRCPKFSS